MKTSRSRVYFLSVVTFILLSLITGNSLGSNSAFLYERSEFKPFSSAPVPLNIGYLGNSSSSDSNYVLSQIKIESSFNVTKLELINITSGMNSLYDIIVLNAINLSVIELNHLKSYLSNGGKLFLIAGINSQIETNKLAAFGVINETSEVIFVERSDHLNPIHPVPPIIQDIEWGSAPELRGYLYIEGYNISTQVILTNSNGSLTMMYELNYGLGKVIGLNAPHMRSINWNLQLWWYTPYFFYRVLASLGSGTSTPDGYQEWEYSPVPHISDRTFLIVFIIAANIVIVILYLIAKKRSRNPIRLNIAAMTRVLKKTSPRYHGIKSAAPKEDPTKLNDSDKVNLVKLNKWEDIGLQRQISSFFLHLLTTLGLNLPFLFITVSVYSRYLQPFPMISGSVGWISGIYGGIYIILEFGLSASVTKYFSEYRIHSPQDAIKYAQIFTWYNMFMNIAQATISLFIGLFVLPQSNIGYMAYFMIFCALVHVPGSFGVIGLVMDALQRFDIRVKLNAILGVIVNTMISYSVLIGFRVYFSTLPQFGEAFGAAMGVIFGGYIAGVFDFFIFMMVYRKMGFSVGNLFRVDFKLLNLKEAFFFGGKLTVGNAWRAIAQIVEFGLIAAFVLNYNEEIGYYGLTGNLTSMISVLSAFITSFLPAISEAFGNKKLKLTEYYLIQAIKWTNFFLFFMVAVVSATGVSFLMLASSAWYGALKYAPWQIFFCMFWPMAWYADIVFQGTGHSGYNTLVWIIEQGTRLVLLFFFLPMFGLMGLYFAYIPGIFAKDLSSLIIIRKKILKFRMNWVQMVIAPALSAVCIYICLVGLQTIFAAFNPISGGILFGIGLTLGLVLHGFLTGLFSGWDPNNLLEFKLGIDMVRTTSKIFNPIYRSTEAGYRLSPWKNKFEIKLYDEAKEEAFSLTEEKRKHL